MHPKNRRVLASDLELLGLSRLQANIIGGFSSLWHPNHALVNWQTGELL
jgi:hypothetical protein